MTRPPSLDLLFWLAFVYLLVCLCVLARSHFLLDQTWNFLCILEYISIYKSPPATTSLCLRSRHEPPLSAGTIYSLLIEAHFFIKYTLITVSRYPAPPRSSPPSLLIKFTQWFLSHTRKQASGSLSL